MPLPHRLPGLRLATILWAVYAAIWITLEGELWRVVLLAVWTCAVALAHLLQKYAAGRIIGRRRWLAVLAILGLLLGAGNSILTIAFMAVKTGLHGHGPEFSLEEFDWVIGRAPLWSLAGLLAGLGLGLITFTSSRDNPSR